MDRPGGAEQRAEKEAADERAGDADHDVGDAAETAARHHAGRDRTGDETDDDPGKPRARIDGEVGGENHARSHSAIVAKTSSPPRSLKGSWKRPSRRRRVLVFGARRWSSSLPEGSMRGSAVPARMRKGILISAAWARFSCAARIHSV